MRATEQAMGCTVAHGHWGWGDNAMGLGNGACHLGWARDVVGRERRGRYRVKEEWGLCGKGEWWREVGRLGERRRRDIQE